MSRQKLLIANWKLNHSRESARQFFATLSEDIGDDGSVELAVAPVAPMLELVSSLVPKIPIKLAAQNVFYEDKGAFTGEWSVNHLRELGVTYCLIGHSERRALFHESDQVVAKKFAACVRGDVVPVLCVGESQEERDAGRTWEIIDRQLTSVFAENHSITKPLIVAYEPIWAIGTGNTATPAQVEEVHGVIRNLVTKSLGQGLAQLSRILYGGSVNGQNIADIAANPNVDGALVGGASLQADSFLSMVKALQVEKGSVS